MKKLALVLAFLLMASNAFAYLDVSTKTLDDSSGTSLDTFSLTSGSTVYSQTIYVADNVGFSSILVTEDKSGGAGDVDISVEYSMDASNWYTAYDSDMAGTLTAEGNIATAFQNVTRWIVHQVRLAKYMRYKFDPDADSQITVKHIYQRDR